MSRHSLPYSGALPPTPPVGRLPLGRRRERWALVLLLGVAAGGTAGAQQGLQVRGQVNVRHVAAKGDNSGAVVWLTPASGGASAPASPAAHFRMAQRNKTFVPAVLVVPLGATVDFPNFDPYFHNVFSLGDARPFDLGLYQAGGSRSQRFSRAGVSYVFCNIHPQMSAVIVTVPTPWYAISDASGGFRLSDVPPGNYLLHVWYERAAAAALAALTRPLTVGADTALPPLALTEVALPTAHKNKYGKDYSTVKAYGPGGGSEQ